MGWGDRINLKLKADQRKVANLINEYVKVHGYNVVMKKSDLDDLIKDIDLESKIYQHSDVCYNKANEGTLKNFESDVHIYEKVKPGYYRLLGDDYPYTGLVEHAANSKILGEWLNGKLVVWDVIEQENINEYENRVKKEFEEIDLDLQSITGEERLVITKQRVNQTIFRRRLLKRYNNHCCLCGVTGESMLIASHIKPWSVSDLNERVDVNNGLLCCPNHDWLFDKGYISFNDEGNVVVSEDLNGNNQIFMNINRDMILNMTEQNKIYMKYHRENILR